MNDSFQKNTESISELLEEIRIEQKISPLRDINELKNYVLEGIYDIEYFSGCFINFNEDKQARELLKNYVLFADHNLLSKFKEDYYAEYINLQIKYSRTIIQ